VAVRVVVVGSVNMDLVVATETLPERGQTVRGGDLQRFGGGKGANQAIAAARMGAEVVLVGRVGGDEFGARLVGDLEREGIDVAAVSRTDAPTGVALITVDAAGANTIVVAAGANTRLRPGDVDAARATIERADALVLQLEVPIEANVSAAELARAAGVPVFLNPSPAAPLPASLLDASSYLVLNETELGLLAGLPADPAALLGRGVGAVVLTLGERGARLISRDGERAVAPYPVVSVDSTAAGDAFLGTLAAVTPELGIEAALDWACAAGGLATTKWGAQPSLPGRADVIAAVGRGREAWEMTSSQSNP
jgi:ribokinase